jgi:hypothetical protein
MGDGEEVSIGKTVQFSHGETEAADSVASRSGGELWLTWTEIVPRGTLVSRSMGDGKLVGICGRTWSAAVI